MSSLDRDFELELDLASAPAARAPGSLKGPPGILPRQAIRGLKGKRVLSAAATIEEGQYQPASLDLRLGTKAYRVRASFLPGDDTVLDKLASMNHEVISLADGAVFQKGSVYVVELMEALRLPKNIVALANPKSSTGRLDLFTRLITDRSSVFDTVAAQYSGRLYLEVSPRSFSVRVRQGTRLNQLRFRRFNSNQKDRDPSLSDKLLRATHSRSKLVDGKINLRNGLILSVALSGSGIIGYKAQKNTDIIDFDAIDTADVADFWDPIRARNNRLILDPDEFYILASKERIHIPPELAAEMVAIDPAMGEFRVHYAGFFDPGFGYSTEGYKGSKAVMEVRSHEVPFSLEDGQMVCRLAYESMADKPDALYGEIGTSNYQGQDLKLSKQFRAP